MITKARTENYFENNDECRIKMQNNLNPVSKLPKA
jgi:hypothetical protein